MMLRWFLKYSAVIFLSNTVLLSIEATRFIGDYLFLFLMSFYAIILLLNPNLIKTVLLHKAFSFLLIIIFINIVYFFIFHSFSDIDAIQYLLARTMQFSIICISIYVNFDYYKNSFLDYLVYMISFVVFIGFFYNIDIFSDRYSGIIWNPNMLSSFTSIAFSILFLKKESKTNFQLLLLCVLFLITLSTGSRGALVAIFLAFFFKYGLKKRNLLYAILGLVFYFILIDFQFNTSINRFASMSLFNDRIYQYQYAYETLMQKPLSGFGLDKYAYINPSLIPDNLRSYNISAHNGYLAILTQYGLVIGSLVLYIILSKSYELFSFFKDYNKNEKIYLFILVYAVLASVYEALITGINEFHTILFWFSLAFLSYTKYKKEDGV